MHLVAARRDAYPEHATTHVRLCRPFRAWFGFGLQPRALPWACLRAGLWPWRKHDGLQPRRSSSLRISRTFSKSRCEWKTSAKEATIERQRRVHRPAQGNALGHGNQKPHQPQRGETNRDARRAVMMTRPNMQPHASGCAALSGLGLVLDINPGRCPGLAWGRAFGPRKSTMGCSRVVQVRCESCELSPSCGARGRRAPTARSHASPGQRPGSRNPQTTPAPTGRNKPGRAMCGVDDAGSSLLSVAGI